MLARHAKVLVVEDNDAVRDLLVKILERMGCVTVTVSNGEHAWLMLLNDLPDLIIVDHHLRALDGASLTERIRRVPVMKIARLPIVGITADDDSAQHMKLAGASEVVLKPFRVEALVSAVKAHVTCVPC